MSLAACAAPAPNRDAYDAISAEMSRAAIRTEPARPEAVAAALLPPITIEMPKRQPPREERFSLAFNNVPAPQFFMSIVDGTRYNMLVHPEVAGNISANLKDVTIFEALDAVRELYGYDYKVEGNRIVIKPLTMQTSVFQVNYLTGNRRGSSETRVSGGSITDSQGSNNGSGNNQSNNNNNNNGSNPNTPSSNQRSIESSKISTSSNSDFWSELKVALETIVGTGKDGRSIVISPQSGVVVVRALPDELRSVSSYLKAMQLSVDRQVILEAKILEVQLNDSYQSGINWAAFGNRGNSRVSAGLLGQNSALSPGSATGGVSISDGNIKAVPGQDIISNGAAKLGGLFGLAFQTSNFAALISFLESQGNVHVLSSPRIATLNNQKAILKVGTDEFFVTGISTTTTATGNNAVTTPTVTLQPFFSGVVLDVTPQIDDRGNIILHVHPSVSEVTTVNKSVNVGGGAFNLPLASSNTSETDSIVRGRDGQIVAIGGLMRQSAVSDRAQLPGIANTPVIGALLGNTNRLSQKRELVILLKPTIVQGDAAWSQDILESQRRIQDLDPRGTTEFR
ncbi:MAG: pilus (MSHA type) biogenesis protein MshL [Herminiimonas sp.]|nr:pilus (MSHA type) biogenesis protein MshL [Herminiimonas sp.]